VLQHPDLGLALELAEASQQFVVASDLVRVERLLEQVVPANREQFLPASPTLETPSDRSTTSVSVSAKSSNGRTSSIQDRSLARDCSATPRGYRVAVDGHEDELMEPPRGR